MSRERQALTHRLDELWSSDDVRSGLLRVICCFALREHENLLVLRRLGLPRQAYTSLRNCNTISNFGLDEKFVYGFRGGNLERLPDSCQ